MVTFNIKYFNYILFCYIYSLATTYRYTCKNRKHKRIHSMSFPQMKILCFCPWCVSLFSVEVTYCPFFSWLSNLLSAKLAVLYPLWLSHALCLTSFFSGLREATHQVYACIHTLCSYSDSDPEKNKHLTSEQHLVSLYF